LIKATSQGPKVSALSTSPTRPRRHAKTLSLIGWDKITAGSVTADMINGLSLSPQSSIFPFSLPLYPFVDEVFMQSLYAVCLVVVMLIGCAPAPKTPPPTFADQLERERQELAALRDKWARGKALVQEGEETVKKGEQLIEQGKRKSAEGQALIERGRRLMEEAEQAYQMRTGTGVSTFPLEDLGK
jgi:hypothetical protein